MGNEARTEMTKVVRGGRTLTAKPLTSEVKNWEKEGWETKSTSKNKESK